MSELEWRKEMRRIAIEDGRRFNWPDAPTRSRYTDKGARISQLRCTYAFGDDDMRTFWFDDGALWSNGSRTQTIEPQDQYTTTGRIDEPGRTIFTVSQQYPSASGGGQFTIEQPEGMVVQQMFWTNSSRQDCGETASPFTPAQREIIPIIRGQVATITTRPLDPDNQLPAWVAHFEPLRATMTPWAWHQEIRKIAIEDGRRFGWPEAPTRGNYTDSGARINEFSCQIRDQLGPFDPTFTPFTARILIDGDRVVFSDNAPSSPGALPLPGPDQMLDESDGPVTQISKTTSESQSAYLFERSRDVATSSSRIRVQFDAWGNVSTAFYSYNYPTQSILHECPT